MTVHYMEICKAMGLKADDLGTELFSRKELDEEAERIFDRHGIDKKDTVVGINPGAKFGSSKCWPPEYFAKIADMVTEKFGSKVVIFAGPGEDEIARKIESLCQRGIINTAPDKISLSLLKPMIRRCRLLVTNDTGPRHYATAFKVPAIVIMGPTNPAYTEYGLDMTTILRADADCSPCHRHVCNSDHRCMTSISPEMVFKEVEKILDARVIL